MMQLIVNADDLGYSTEVNHAIFDLMARGHVTSSTLLANGPALEDAVRGIHNYQGCSFGVHLNLTEFRPLAACAELLPIIDEQGCFAGNIIRSTRITDKLREAIFHEWCAQIQRLLSLEVTLSHIDSHHHVHTIPGLFPVLKRVQRRFGIRKVRISRNIYPLHVPAARLLLLRKLVWNFALRHYYRTTTSSGFTNLATFLEVAQRQPLQHRSVELMVHPGNPGSEQESQILAQSWWDCLSFSTKLISYHDLLK